MGRLLVLALACVCGLGWVQGFTPLSPSLVSSCAPKSGPWGHERRKPSSSSLASVRPERPTGWRGLVLGGGGHGRSGGTGNGGGGGNWGGGGAGGGAFGWSKEGSGDDGEGDDGVELPGDVSELLAKAGRKFAELPASTQKALVGGTMTSALLQRYLELEKKGGIVAGLLGMGIFRDRLLMDAYLMDKMGIEMAVGAAAQVLAEWDRRREKLMDELDFAFADVLTCLVANFAAVLIAAPSVAGAAVAPSGRNIPANMFQMVPPGARPYALSDRLISPFLKVPTLFAVGMVASLLGYGTTSVLTSLRNYLHEAKNDPMPSSSSAAAATGSRKWFGKKAVVIEVEEEAPAKIPVFKTSLAVGAFLAVSTNIRYQLISGVVEERGIAKFLAHNKLTDHLASFVVRSCNTYIGSVHMIDFLKLLGLQQ